MSPRAPAGFVWVVTLAALVCVGGCDPLDDPGDEECFSVWAEPASVEVAGDAGVPAGAFFSIDPPDRLAGTTRVDDAIVSLWVTHTGVREDCGVAIYRSEVAADPSALPIIEAGTSPPEQIDGLGERVGSVRLARAAAEHADAERFEVALPLSARSFLTVAACPGAELTVSAQLIVEACTDDRDAVPYEPVMVSVVE